jgi:hypothetical protein
LSGEETRPLVCPFCGAPQSAVVPAGVVQIECKYCGGLILVPPWMGGEVHRCPNHPDKLATGKCNDCGENFCDECLSAYTLRSREDNAVLYLCPDCLRKRRTDRANAVILQGVAFVFIGTLLGLVVWSAAIITGLLGVGIIAYGASQRAVPAKEPTTREQQGEEAKEGGDVEEDFDAEKVYDKLVTRYVNRWGAMTGIDLLDKEISAYTLHGESFAHAVRKISEREERNRHIT